MSFTLVDSVNLIAWLVFVLWEPTSPSRKDVAWYSHFRADVFRLNPPSWVFLPVWLVLKGLFVAAMVLFTKWSSEGANGTGDWTFLAVYIVAIVHTLVKKGWPMLFFKLRLFGLSLVIVITTVITAILLVVFSALSGNNTGYLFPMIVAFFALELAWLAFATVLSYYWYSKFYEGGKILTLSTTFSFAGSDERGGRTRRSRNKQEEP